MHYVTITMFRPHIRGIPQHPLPAGFALRFYRPGDAEAWVRIHHLAYEHEEWTRETFDSQFGGDLAAMEDRCFFLVTPDGRDIGTTTAWYDNDFYGARVGRIHWVAICREFQGRGLAKPLLTAAMNRLAKSHNRFVLSTQAVRIPAINLYLDYGFRPYIRKPEDLAEWDQVRRAIKHPLLDAPPFWPDLT